MCFEAFLQVCETKEKDRIKRKRKIWPLVCRVPWCVVVARGKTWLVQAAIAAQVKPETQDADIHFDEDVANVRNFLADIMKESRRVRK